MTTCVFLRACSTPDLEFDDVGQLAAWIRDYAGAQALRFQPVIVTTPDHNRGLAAVAVRADVSGEGFGYAAIKGMANLDQVNALHDAIRDLDMQVAA